MIRLSDKIKSFIYRVLRSDTPNGYNSCGTCKKKRKNWADATFKPGNLVGFDNVLSEWVIFADYNVYAKIWVMNGYITNIFKLSNNLWNDIKPLCRCCITNYLKSYIEPACQEDDES